MEMLLFIEFWNTKMSSSTHFSECLWLCLSFFKWAKGGGGADFIAAEVAYRSWSSSPSSNQETLDCLLKSMDKHPELHQKYDAPHSKGKECSLGVAGAAFLAAAQTFL